MAQVENRELIELASQKVGGLSELARNLKWDKGSIAAIKSGRQSMPAYRAAQLAALLGHDEQAAYLKALAAQAKTPEEKHYWLSRLARGVVLGCSIKTILLSFILTTSEPSEAKTHCIFKENATNIHYEQYCVAVKLGSFTQHSGRGTAYPRSPSTKPWIKRLFALTSTRLGDL